ncbi:MAG TPA: site-specific integrase, partial [Paracoccaceae bacterium]|nr:site-specific integrase [Paracoccaceae bacterium]
MTGLAAATEVLVEQWGRHLAGARGASGLTIGAYRHDVIEFLGFLGWHWGGPALPAALARVETRDVRAWMAAARGRGLSARSLARALSAVKGFYRWLAETQDMVAPAIQAAR